MTAETLPAPLTPHDCDLRDFPAMLVYIDQLFGSSFHALSEPLEWKTGVSLWLRSFHQVPAGSLPGTDKELATLAGFGENLKKFSKIREKSLRGWFRASDGRFYHKTVAVVVLEAWLEKLSQRKLSGAGNAQRWNTPFDSNALDLDIVKAADLLESLNHKSKVLGKRVVKDARGNLTRNSEGNPGGIPNGVLREGKGSEGKSKKYSEGKPSELRLETGTPNGTRKPKAEETPLDDSQWVFRVGLQWLQARTGEAESKTRKLLGKWTKEHAVEVVRAALERAIAEGPGEPVSWITAALKQAPREVNGRHDEAPLAMAAAERNFWWNMVRLYKRSEGRTWPVDRGEPPPHRLCQAPADVLEEFGYRQKAPAH